jgi:hypothetical protein
VYIIEEPGISGGYTSATAQYTFTSRGSGNTFMMLIQTGMAAGYRIGKNLKASFGINNYSGLTKVETYNVVYKIGNEPSRNAIIKDRGGFVNYCFRLGYIFNR